MQGSVVSILRAAYASNSIGSRAGHPYKFHEINTKSPLNMTRNSDLHIFYRYHAFNLGTDLMTQVCHKLLLIF